MEKTFTSKIINGSLLRSKVPGIEEGDTNLAYYSKLEKMRADENTIFSLMNKEGSLSEGTENIFNVVFDYYKGLYTKELECGHLQDEFLNKINVKLNQEERDSLDKDFTCEELGKAMSDLKPNKSPGSDGLTKEFFDYFWDLLCPLYMDCLKEIEETHSLTESQKLGLIRISYKKNGRVFIENYRPITLLNVDLKILTRTLAVRMASVLSKLIHDNQRCVPGRKITKNIHIVQDLIDVINKSNGKGALIFLDQEKAFDRISHTFIMKTLRAFGFGERFINWVKIVYSDTRSQVKINGFLTPSFPIERGVRQGCPLSALLYVLCAEVLGIAIRSNKNIHGFKYGNNEHKISQYADDMNAVVTTEASIEELFTVLDKYERATNAKLNRGKTEALWVGEWRDRVDKPLGLRWTSDKVNFLGVFVGNDREDCSLQSFSIVIEKIRAKFSYWKGKFLTLKGRVKTVNIFIFSKLWYILECQDFPITLKNDLDKNLTDFIWNDIHQRELNVVYREECVGGLNLQDPHTKMLTYRITWLHELFKGDPKSIELHLANSLIGNHGQIKGIKLLHASSKYDKNIENSFYKNSMKAWRQINPIFCPGNLQSIRRDVVYENMLLVDDNCRPFKYPSRIPAYAPEYICDLPVTNHPREFKGIFKTLIPKINLAYMKMKYNDSGLNEYYIMIAGKRQNLALISFNVLYSFLLNSKPNQTCLWVGKWEEDTGIPVDAWPEIWSNATSKMLNYQVQSSLWETLHRNFMCGYFARIAFNEQGICKLCNTEELTRTHIFMSCEVVLLCYNWFLFITDKVQKVGPVDLLERAFGLRKPDPVNHGIDVRNYINFCIRHVVYRNRNNVLGRSINSTFQNLCKKIIFFIHKDLKSKYHRCKLLNDVDKFKETFLVGNALGQIVNHELILFKPP